MGVKFEALIPLYIPAILKLCSRTSKIYLSRAQNCLKLISACCRVPALVVLLKDALTEKTISVRFASMDALHDLLSTGTRDGFPKKGGKWVDDVEWMIKTSARDSNPETRKMARRALASYSQLWPDRVSQSVSVLNLTTNIDLLTYLYPRFVSPMSPTTRRYLEITDAPSKSNPPKRPQTAIGTSSTTSLSRPNPSSSSNLPQSQTSPSLSRTLTRTKSHTSIRPTSSHARVEATTKDHRAMGDQAGPSNPHQAPRPARSLRHAASSNHIRSVNTAPSSSTNVHETSVPNPGRARTTRVSRPPSRNRNPVEVPLPVDVDEFDVVETQPRAIQPLILTKATYTVPLHAEPPSRGRSEYEFNSAPPEASTHGRSTSSHRAPNSYHRPREHEHPVAVVPPPPVAAPPTTRPPPPGETPVAAHPPKSVSSVLARVQAIEQSAVPAQKTHGRERVENERTERYLYPFAAAATFVPTSRRQRELAQREKEREAVEAAAAAAIAVRVPLPPSPKMEAQTLTLPSFEPPAMLAEPQPESIPTRPASAASHTSSSNQVASSSRQPERAPGKGAFAGAVQPTFRPARRTPENAPPPVQRKVSAFGAPAIITVKAAPPLPLVPLPNVMPVNRGPPSTVAANTGANANTNGNTKSLATKKSIIQPSGKPTATTVTATATASSTSTSSRAVSAPSHQASTTSSTASKSRVVSQAAPSSKSSKSTSIPASASTPASSTATAPPPVPRIRNATGMTTSQMLKQKPSVHKGGFVPVSKLRGAKTVSNLKAPPAPRPGAVTSASRGAAKAPEPEVAAQVPLPPSPKSQPAALALVASEGVATPMAAVEPVRQAEPEPAFPTLENIKARLSVVDVSVAQTQAHHGQSQTQMKGRSVSTSSAGGEREREYQQARLAGRTGGYGRGRGQGRRDEGEYNATQICERKERRTHNEAYDECS